MTGPNIIYSLHTSIVDAYGMKVDQNTGFVMSICILATLQNLSARPVS